MSSDHFTIQILEKETASPSISSPFQPLSPLAANSIRVKSTLISLTRNNLSYARLGSLLGWWDVHPLPANIPATFSDPSVYGRISAWGYGTIISSTIPSIRNGEEVYGYLPIGTLPVDLKLEPCNDVRNQWREVSPHRAKQLNIYNRYTQFPAPKGQLSEEEKKSKAYDVLMQGLFETSYNLSRLTFAWEGPAVHPFTGGLFEAEKADISNSLVIITPAGSKTALALAQQLRASSRPKEAQPRIIIGVGSLSSKTLATESGFYDEVLEYAHVRLQSVINRLLGGEGNITKAIVVDVGSRSGEAEKWVQVLRNHLSNVLPLIISSNASPEVGPPEGFVRVNASVLRDRGMELQGEKGYFERFDREWRAFKKGVELKGWKLSMLLG